MRLWNHKPQISHPTEAKCILNLCQLVSTQRPHDLGQNEPTPMPTQPTPSAWEPTCLVEFPPLFFCIQEKEKLAIAGSNAKHHGSITHHIRQFPNKINGAMRPSTESPHLFATKHMCYAATPWIWMMLNWCGRHEAVGVDTGYRLRCWLSYDSIPFCPIMSRLDLDCLAWAEWSEDFLVGLSGCIYWAVVYKH